MKLRCQYFVVVLLVIGCAKDEPDLPERTSVRAFLSESSPSGKWTEEDWWPAAPLEGSQYRKPSDKQTWHTISQQGRSIRARIRTETADGENKLLDMVFVIDDSGEVVESLISSAEDFRLPGESEAHWMERMSKSPEASARMQQELLSGQR